ncbi:MULTISPECIES: DUF4844 domain-containing protein [unclassified Duganella]|uniref:DUF4844 domain-containing protein n=1 Tax=unclassified Duganella TaxID=2636909 RepID=UPI000710EC55|nr:MULTISPECIES: DUF4844 domain-containing protein [unclassified Duganella]KQZ40013.1 hypothetical protein ASD58_06430 [Duganella sp. Root1480D1]KRC00619.1 hypothetical protein ASE26_23170 [Duganella sp. Root198D2]
MTYDPITEVEDEALIVDDAVIADLVAFRSAPKLEELPGLGAEPERELLSDILNALVDKLIVGVGENPSKRWVLTQIQSSLRLVEDEDTEARDHFGMEIEEIMDILGIESSDGLLSYYLGGI